MKIGINVPKLNIFFCEDSIKKDFIALVGPNNVKYPRSNTVAPGITLAMRS
jgi:hypothetical protein